MDNTLLSIFFILAAGLLLSRVVKLVNLPNVTGYLFAGLLIGPFIGHLVTKETLDSFGVITNVALGFVAFSIGGEFKLQHIKQIGARAICITFFEAVGAVVMVMLGLTLVHFLVGGEAAPTPLILVLGAIAAATAPAATLMVVRQYKAKGPVTDALLPVVALDDAIGLMIFAVCIALAKVFANDASAVTFYSVAVVPLLEILISLALGGVIGVILSLCMKFFKSRANRLSLMLAAVLLGIALTEIISSWLPLSSLLVCMMIGAVFANMRQDSVQILEGIERWTPPLFMMFFVISGANLQLDMLPQVGIVGIVYILSRALGKYTGARLGATVVKAQENIRKYLGLALVPQAGVAIGMAVSVAAEPQMAAYADQIVTVVVCATLVYELIGPVLTKIALTRAGEIEKKKKDTAAKTA